MSLVYRDIIDEPSAWRAADLAASDRWIRHLDESDLAEFDQYLQRVADTDVLAITRADAQFGKFDDKLNDIVTELEHGSGVILLRGLPIFERYSLEQAAKIYWGMCSHMGRFATVNHAGEILSDIRAVAAKEGEEVADRRGYTKSKNDGRNGPFHSDPTDIVGLMCVRPAAEGGESYVASATEMHNVILREHPELLDVLYQNFAVDFKDEQPPGALPWYAVPTFSLRGGRVSTRLGTTWARDAAKNFPEVPELTDDEDAAFKLVETIPGRDDMALEFRMETGDIEFLYNYTTVHTRGGFTDDPSDPTKIRHMLRLWMSRPHPLGRQLAPELDWWRDPYCWWRR